MCGGQAKITIPVRTFYEKVVGVRIKAKMAIELFPYKPIQRISVRTSYEKVAGSRDLKILNYR